MKKFYQSSLIVAAIAIFGLAIQTQATIVTQSLWSMGEPGSLGGTGNLYALDTVISDGALNNMNNIFSGVSYLSATPPPFTGSSTYLHLAPVSSLSGEWMFNPSGTGQPATTAQTLPSDNYGFEVWVRATANVSNFAPVMFIGDGVGGLQLDQTSGSDGQHWAAVRDGQAWLVSAPFTPGAPGTELTLSTWYDLALVRDNGVTKMFVNGVQVGSGDATAPSNSGFVGFGIQPRTGGFNFAGDIDEARVFTFSAGQFTTSDLYINNLLVPEPSTAALVGVSGLMILGLRRRSKNTV